MLGGNNESLHTRASLISSRVMKKSALSSWTETSVVTSYSYQLC